MSPIIQQHDHDDGLVHGHAWAMEPPRATAGVDAAGFRPALSAARRGTGRARRQAAGRPYPAKPAARFTAAARMTALNRKATAAWSSTSRRIAGVRVVASETWKVMPTVKAK